MPEQSGEDGPSVLKTVTGHNDAFMAVSDSKIWKMTDAPERDMLIRLMESPELSKLVPTYSGEVGRENWIGKEPGADSVVVQLQDLTASFGRNPCIMDIKMGIRTFLEDEVSNPKVREDLLKKMDKLDKEEATEAERAAGGITKLRYMQFRERASTSSSLGYRLEAMQLHRAPGGVILEQAVAAAHGGPAVPSNTLQESPSKEQLSKIQTEAGVAEALRRFTMGDKQLQQQYLARLKAIHATLAASDVFSEHQFINTSLLFIHNNEWTRCGVWMIDFSKARPAAGRLSHTVPWELGNQEDGYLFGLANLVSLWDRL